MAVHDHAVFTVRRFNAFAVREEVSRQFRGRYSLVIQAPEDVVARTVAVDFHHAQIGCRIELDVAEKFPRTGDDKRRIRQQRHRLTQRDIAWFFVEIGAKWRDICFIKTQRQVTAVTLVPAFQPRIRSGFDHPLDEPGSSNVLHVRCSCLVPERYRVLRRPDKRSTIRQSCFIHCRMATRGVLSGLQAWCHG